MFIAWQNGNKIVNGFLSEQKDSINKQGPPWKETRVLRKVLPPFEK